MASTPVERAAPRGERLKDQQQADRLQTVGAQKRMTRLGNVVRERVDQPDGDDGQQAEDEEHRWQEKCARRLAEPAQIHEGDEGEEPEA